jgi:uncharacterized protein
VNLILALLSCSSITWAASSPRYVSVTGVCQKKILPDRGRLTLTVSVLDADVGDASKKAISEYESLRRDVKALQLKDGELETVEYSVNEETEWVKNKQVHKGFRARMGLSVSTSDIQKISDVIFVASKHNVKEVGSLEMFLSTAENKIVHEDCLQTALLNAKEKAGKMAKALGAGIGEVLTIEETPGDFRPGPRPFRSVGRSAVAMDSMAGAPQLETKAEDILVNVAASFELK